MIKSVADAPVEANAVAASTADKSLTESRQPQNSII